MPWSLEFIEKYQDKLNWGWYGLSSNKALPWSLELIEKYKDKWDWRRLSENEGLPWTLEFIEKYKDKWDWSILSGNEALPWTMEFIEKYQKWDVGRLSRNEALPWTKELIEKYQDNWNKHDISRNKRLLSTDFVEKCQYVGYWFEEKDIYWDSLSMSEFLPWSFDFIEKYRSQLNWRSIKYNQSALVCLPKLSLQDIDEVMSHHFHPQN